GCAFRQTGYSAGAGRAMAEFAWAGCAGLASRAGVAGGVGYNSNQYAGGRTDGPRDDYVYQREADGQDKGTISIVTSSSGRMGRGAWAPPLPPENLDVRLPRDFFHRPTLEVCQDIIGQYFFSSHDGVITGGRIVEAEAYCGPDDLGAHT